MSETGSTIHLSLLSHTNAGKTTLARTLLRRDVGEVDDRAHVTEIAERHTLIETPQGDALVLWDTPGFGDSARLLRRLQSSTNPLGWLLSRVWDRWVDRPFWCSQQAMRAARDASDVLLYVVNAGEAPAAATYVGIELAILAWIDRPIVLLLNQLGPPRAESQTQIEVLQWQAKLAAVPQLRAVLPLDAFARCWVQEHTLLEAVAAALPNDKRAAFARLQAGWHARNLQVLQDSVRVLARQLATLALDEEPLAVVDAQEKARAWLGGVVTGSVTPDPRSRIAQHALAQRLDTEVRAATQELVRLHGLEGRAAEEVLQLIGREFAIERPADADKASLLGGLVSGALGGLAADLAAGGLTFGAGALLGGILGAFSARGLAQAYNVARGTESGNVRWSQEFLDGRSVAALVRYLAVAHFGRGRGEFVSGSTPAHWQQLAGEVIAERRGELEEVWLRATRAPTHGSIEQSLVAILGPAVRELLRRLYPQHATVS